MSTISVLVAALLALGLFGLHGCSKDEPTRPEAPPEVPPVVLPSIGIQVQPSYLVCLPIPMDVIYQKGDSALVAVSVGMQRQGDTVRYDTSVVPTNTATAETLHLSPSFSQIGTYLITATAHTADTAVTANASVVLQDVLASLWPAEGPAPLTVTLSLASNLALVERAYVDWEDGSDTLAYSPFSSYAHTYALGEFTIRVAFLHGTDTIRVVNLSVNSYNTPPQLIGPLPGLSGAEDSLASFASIALEPFFADSLTPAAELSYSIMAQHGPAVAVIDSLHVLRIGSLQADGNGAGEITVLVEDPQGLSVQAVVHTHTEPLPDVTIWLQDYNGNPLAEGMIVLVTNNYNGVQIPYAQLLVLQLTPGRRLIGGFSTSNGQAASYQRTVRPDFTVNDTTLHIPVVPYSILEGICTPEEFYDLTGEARMVPIRLPGEEFHTGFGKMRLDSAYLGFQNGGITIYIEKQPSPGYPISDSLSNAEQDIIESVILNIHHPYFPPNARAQIYKARWEDPTYFEYGVGPTVQNIITVFMQRGMNPGAATYDDNLDGTLERGVVFVNHLLMPVAILQELLSCELAPGEVTQSMPHRTVLQSIYPALSIQPVDSLLIDTGLKIPAGTRINDVLYGR
ncbi:MAG: hypothetical protein V1784_01820 [bacterium]